MLQFWGGASTGEWDTPILMGTQGISAGFLGRFGGSIFWGDTSIWSYAKNGGGMLGSCGCSWGSLWVLFSRGEKMLQCGGQMPVVLGILGCFRAWGTIRSLLGHAVGVLTARAFLASRSSSWASARSRCAPGCPRSPRAAACTRPLSRQSICSTSPWQQPWQPPWQLATIPASPQQPPHHLSNLHSNLHSNCPGPSSTTPPITPATTLQPCHCPSNQPSITSGILPITPITAPATTLATALAISHLGNHSRNNSRFCSYCPSNCPGNHRGNPSATLIITPKAA